MRLLEIEEENNRIRTILLFMHESIENYRLRINKIEDQYQQLPSEVNLRYLIASFDKISDDLVNIINHEVFDSVHNQVANQIKDEYQKLHDELIARLDELDPL